MPGFICWKPEDKCGYIFKEKRGRNKKRVLTPEPYSKLNSSGEVVVLTDEECRMWVKAYHQAVEELGKDWRNESEEVYHKVEEILKRTGSYRFL
jgi:hypothetical protein